MDTFGQKNNNEDLTTAQYLDQSAFDEKFEIEIEKDYINNIYHVENKYLVPVLAGGYRDMYEYCCKHLIHPADENYDILMDPDKLMDHFANSERNVVKAEFREKLVDGTFHWVQYLGITGKENGVPEGKVYFYVYDIQNQKDRLEGRAVSRQYNSSLDPLTGLKNREEFLIAVSEKLGKEVGMWCCVAFDIQHFKMFNTWFGYEKGDYLLSRIGNYLAEFEKNENALAAYFGADNFAILMRDDNKKIEQIYNTVRDFISSYSNMLGFLPAFGVYCFEGKKSGFDIYDKARLAVGDAKKNYGNRISYFDYKTFERTKENIELLTEYQIERGSGELTFFLQPQCRISDGKIIGAEALVRWIMPDGKVIYPSRFVPFLEKNGFITEMDKSVWNLVCKWIRNLLDRNITPIPVSINVSRIDLISIDVAAYLYSLTQTYHILPKYLKVEITESAYAEDYEKITNSITELKKRGFTVILDDFGAGYSSLNMLDKINVDIIKLDMLFMKKDNSLGKKGIGIVESIFGMTKALELPVIVEGVETSQQVGFLNNLGFKYVQGYYFYKPMNVSDFENLLKNNNQVDYKGIEKATSDLFTAKDFLKENMLTESTLNKILGAVAFYSLENENITITRFNEPFRNAISDVNMDERVENIQNYVVKSDHAVLYQTLKNAENNTTEGGKCEVRFTKSDGSIFWFRMNFYYLRKDGSKKIFFGQVEDITEQRDQSLHFFDVLRKQSDVTMCIELDKNKISYVTGENTLYQVDLPSMDLDLSVYQTAVRRIENENDRKAFLDFFDSERLREAYRKAIYHEVLNIDFRLNTKPEPVEFSTYYIRHNRDDSLIVYAFAKKRDREILSLDPLTGLKNRYAYNETIEVLTAHGKVDDNLIVFSMDVNDLKSTNDTKGHLAGDELIQAAAQKINLVMSPYGKAFRIGGDEFAAFVYGNGELAEYLKNELNDQLAGWSGKMVNNVSVSTGYASSEEFPNLTFYELIRMADFRMYRCKSQYYQQLGIDRRMQQAAFNAICYSYTKILKINLSQDSYEIIQVDEKELKDNNNNTATLSGWLYEFAQANRVHPDDKAYYMKYTSLDYIRNYFKSGKKHYGIYYRRMINGIFSKVMMEIIPAPNYTDDNQLLFMYVKNIENNEEL